MPPLTGFTLAKFPSDILYDAGIVHIGSTPLGVTKGAPKLTHNTSFTNVPFDGKHAPIKGLDREMHGEPVIAFSMIELGDSTTGNQLAKLTPGSTSATVSTTTTVTPAKSGILVASGSYLTDFRVMWERGAAGSGVYFAVYFPCALVTKWDIAGTPGGEATISVEVAGRIDLATQAINDPAFKFEYRTTAP